MKKSTSASLPTHGPAAASGAMVDSDRRFRAARIMHSGIVRVDAPPRLAFQLFTAPGERLWAAGWDPRVMSGGDGRHKGAVFVTTHGDEETVWVVTEFNPEALHVRYARISPGSKAGTVEVSVRADADGGSVAEVTYELTALGEPGNRHLANFGRRRFARMMAEWEQAIRAAEIDYASLTIC